MIDLLWERWELNP